MNLSYSKLTTLLDCQKRFFFEYILKLDREPQLIDYGDLGSRAHLILEEFYKYVNLDANNIEKEFNGVLGNLYHKHFRGVQDPKGSFAKGVRNFCNREIKRYNVLQDKTIFQPRYVELPLETEIAGQYFRGRLDAVYINPDDLSLRPTDYKFTNQNSIKLPQEIQASIYVIMLEQQLNIYCDKYYFWFMKHGLGPTGRGFEKVVDVTDELKDKLRDIITDSAELIEKGEFEGKEHMDYFCHNFCPYYGMCMEEMMGEDVEFED
jgi:RecB family exonuclease